MALDRLTRKPERGSGDRAALDRLLDGQLWGVLGTVTLEGQPWQVPMLYARDGDRILLHGSTGAGALRAIAAGAPMTFCVVAMDALVVSFTNFDSSANYRSAVLRGSAEPLDGADKAAALDALSEKIVPGRGAEVRPSTSKELAATQAMALPIEEGSWLYKERTGGIDEPDEDTDAWAGVIPINLSWGTPEPAPWANAPLPASVRHLVGEPG